MTPIGWFAVACSVLCFFSGPKWLFSATIVLNLLGAASALISGSISIAPGIISLLMTFVSLFLSGHFNKYALGKFIDCGAGLWITLFVIYVLISGYFFPTIFIRSTYVNAIGSTVFEPSTVPSPLVPSSGNFSQAIYVCCSASAFLMVFCFCLYKENIEWMTRTLIVCSMINVIFAFVDLLTYYSNTTFLLDFIRNGPYTLHVEESIHGFKRIAGSFTETSSFSMVTLAFVAFNIQLWNNIKYRSLIRSSVIVQVILLSISTSSTAYVGLVALIGVLATQFFVKIQKKGFTDADFKVVMIGIFIVILITAIAIAIPSISMAAFELIETTVLDKSTSESGVERSSWNMQGMQNLWDTSGIGVGVGGARASSFIVALLSNVGFVGSVLFALFCGSAFFYTKNSEDVEVANLIAATRASALMILITASISGTVMDLGVSFFVLAGICASLKNRPVA